MKTTYNFFLRHQKIIFLVLAVIAGFLILFPLHNFQSPLTQGDHGRDLYAFKQTLDGATPYKDYWWVFSPLMPYYYAVIYKIFGISIQSVLLGELLLKIGAGAFFYLCLSLFFSPLFSLLSAGWFFVFFPYFFHTYNHAGGILFLLIIIYFLFHYLRDLKKKYLFLALGGIFILFLIKFNIGAYALCALTLSLLLIDWTKKNNPKNKKIFIPIICTLPVLAVGIHWIFFLRELPWYAIIQCFPYFDHQRQYHAQMLPMLFIIIRIYLSSALSSAMNLSLAILTCTFGIILCTKKINDRREQCFRKDVLLALACLFFFILFTLHEFISDGVFYRLFWITPFTIMFVLIIIGAGLRTLKKSIHFLFYGVFLSVISILALTNHIIINSFKTPDHLFQIDETKVYTTNSRSWILTVRGTVQYLKEHLKESETFFALPYEPIYYFLTGRTSPTRLLTFFKNNIIPIEQEYAVIKDLEENNVAYILISSRQKTTEDGLGIFGVTHCPNLAHYINSNFSVVEVFGDWTGDPTKILHHGIKILKRK